jgi:two-component system OmpR family response regulator
MNSASPSCLLLVEDDPLVRDTVALMLEEDGFAVTEAADAHDALQLVRAGLPAQMIVTDVDLGPGPSGADLADELHRVRPELCIIFITGRAASLRDREADEREAVLAKPFPMHALSDMIRRMAQGGSA